MQGFNMGRYVPPDVEGTISANKLHGKHPLGQRASKLASRGALTVRFEMPFAVWCLGCEPRAPTLIGQGVRFNAEKRRAGSYLSTPVWEFRFRHGACGGWIALRTDPRNTAYVVVEGARKRDYGPGDAAAEGEGGVILTDKERDKLRSNAFASLEKTIADRKRLEMAADRIDDLEALSGRHWSDPYARNQRLRRDFRKGRKQRERDAARAEDLRDRMGLGMELVPEVEEDAQRAALVEFGHGEGDGAGEGALLKPLFLKTTATAGKEKEKTQTSTKAEKAASRRKEAFVADVLSNTRAARDPFLKLQHANHGSGSDTKTAGNTRPSPLGIIRRRKGVARDDDTVSDAPGAAVRPVQGLVEYDSD